MLILLAPSKTMDFATPATTTKSTAVLFKEESDQLAAELAKLSQLRLAKLMKISDKIAAQNYERYQSFEDAKEKQALFAYQGDVYRDMKTDLYTTSQLEFAQKHIRILSGLYGMLRPLDMIRPYRLEMSLKKHFWKEPLTKALATEAPKLIINLSSKEYTDPIDFGQLPPHRLITCIFKTGERIIPIHSKVARGTMANFIIENQIEYPEELKAFKEDGWKFDPTNSNDTEFIFSRYEKT